MTHEEKVRVMQLNTNIDKELYDSKTHIITSYINIINDEGKEIPILSTIYNPEEDNDDIVLKRTVTNRLSTNIHHLSIFEEFEKSYLIAYPLGESVDWNFDPQKFFDNNVVKLRVHSTVYFATNYNNKIYHKIASGYTDYTVKLFHTYSTVAEDSSSVMNYAICAIGEIIDIHTGVNGTFGVDDIKEYFIYTDTNNLINTVESSYPNEINVNGKFVKGALKNRIVKTADIINLKNIPTIINSDDENKLSINVKYLYPNMPKIEIIDKGDWIDLCTVGDISLRKGDFRLIPLGVVIQIPEGYEALLLPRSSTFKKWGIFVANSMGVIDNSYRGPDDQWMLAAFATKDIVIPKYTRIAQFRLLKNQPNIIINEITEITDESRGGFGSTGN